MQCCESGIFIPDPDFFSFDKTKKNINKSGTNAVQSQGCGSGLDPDSIGSVVPDPESGFGIRIQEGKK